MRTSIVFPMLALAAALPGQTRFVGLGHTDHLPPAVYRALDAVAGDFDGDGLADLVLLETDGVTVLRGDGTGRFETLARVAAPPAARCGGVALADLDGDGVLEVIFALHDGAAGILRYDGAGGIIVSPSPVAGPVCGLAVGDIDGDGDPDIFAAMSNPPGVSGNLAPQSRLYRNDAGTLVDVTATHLPVERKNTAVAKFFDADGDGDLDLVLGMTSVYLGPSPQNELWLNDGTGRFTATVGALPSDSLLDADLAVGDIDGDGDLDLIAVGSGNSTTALLLRNDGNGVFTSDPGALPSGLSLREPIAAVALADLDGDGDLDLVLGVLGVTGAAPTLMIAWNDGSGSFGPPTTRLTGDGVRRIAVFDADGDAHVDLFLANRHPSESPQRARFLLGAPGGTLVDATQPFQLAPADPTLMGIAFGDVDGDGDLDMIVRASGGTPLRLHLNDGAGNFTDVTATHVPPPLGPVHRHGFVDLDRDGMADVFATDNRRLMLFYGSSTGQLTALPAATVPTPSGQVTEVLAADFDGDGLQDLALQDTFGLQIWRGTGLRTWSLDPRTTFVSGFGRVAIGDIDGDGHLDLVGKRGHLPTDEVLLYLNAGDGSFVAGNTVRLPSVTIFDVVQLADADGDGDLDLFVFGNESTLFLNDGNGVFTRSATFPPLLDQGRGTTCDVDLDGDIDVIGIRVDGSRVFRPQLLLNDGTGRFHDATAAAFGSTPHLGSIATVADIDGDGDPDLITADTATGVRVLQNIHRQARMPWLLRRGHLARIEMIGVPGEPVLPLLATGPEHTPWPPYGFLQLDPATLAVLPPMTIPPSGSVGVSFLFPDIPVLVGVELHLQAFHFGAPAHWGNRAASRPAY